MFPENHRLESLVGPRGRISEWLGTLLQVLLLIYKVCMKIFHRFKFLKVTYEFESDHSSLFSHVYPSWLVTWVDVGRGCYKEHGKDLRIVLKCLRENQPYGKL